LCPGSAASICDPSGAFLVHQPASASSTEAVSGGLVDTLAVVREVLPEGEGLVGSPFNVLFDLLELPAFQGLHINKDEVNVAGTLAFLRLG
jgi:hypothetical protein